MRQRWRSTDSANTLFASRLEKWVLDYKISEMSAVLKIFTVENLAIALDGCRNNQRVVPRELITPCQIQSTDE